MRGGGIGGGIFTILLLGAAGAMLYTVLKNPTGVKALTDGADKLLRTSYGAELGQVS